MFPFVPEFPLRNARYFILPSINALNKIADLLIGYFTRIYIIYILFRVSKSISIKLNYNVNHLKRRI